MPHCLKKPVPEIYKAAELLQKGTNAHIEGNAELAKQLFKAADINEIRQWTESIWGVGGIYSSFFKSLGSPPKVSKEKLDPKRMPNKEGQKELLLRDGHFCRFCRIPVIRKEVRVKLHSLYPNEIPWGKSNSEQHAAFQAMWVQYDHLIPHARGGKTTSNNMIITCAPCNYGRMNYLLDEVAIKLLPKQEPSIPYWDGLESILMASTKNSK